MGTWSPVDETIAYAIEGRVAGIDPAPVVVNTLPRRAGIRVSELVVAKVLTREGAVVALGPIHGLGREARSASLRPASSAWAPPRKQIGGEPLRLEAEALFGALQHGSCGTHFGLADRARGFNIHDHAALDVDQIVVGISKEHRSLERARSIAPLGRRAIRTSAALRSLPRTPRH